MNSPFRFPASPPMALALGVAASVCLGIFFLPSNGERHPRTTHWQGRHIDTETSCGPVSLSVVSSLLGRPVSISEYHGRAHAGDLGISSLADLVAALKDTGFAAVAVRYSPVHPPSHRLPMVLFVNGDHFIVALPAAEKGVVLIDPPGEPQFVGWDEMGYSWRGEAIVVARTESEVTRAVMGPGRSR